MTTLTLSIPLPPSVNACYGNRPKGQTRADGKKARGRYVTKALEDWREAAGKELMIQARGRARPVFPTAAVSVEVEAALPETVRARRDGDNLLKATLDLLVHHQIIPDDSARYVRKCSVEWVDWPEHPGCIVRITPLETPSLENVSSPRACPASHGKRTETLSSQQSSILAVSGKRRGSQTILTKIKNPEAAVLQLLNSRGIKVEPGRVHVQGGGQS